MLNRSANLIPKIAVLQNSNTGGSCATLPDRDIAWCHARPIMTPTTAITLEAMCVRDTQRPLASACFSFANPAPVVPERLEATDLRTPVRRQEFHPDTGG